MGLMREVGLIFHHMFKPIKKPAPPPGGPVVHQRTKVEEKKVSDTVTLRRTTIDEIEVRQEPK